MARPVLMAPFPPCLRPQPDDSQLSNPARRRRPDSGVHELHGDRMRSLTRSPPGLAIVLAFSAVFQSIQAQVDPPSGWVRILGPFQWRGEGTRGIVVPERRTPRVSGLAYHPTGVTRVVFGITGSLTYMPKGLSHAGGR